MNTQTEIDALEVLRMLKDRLRSGSILLITVLVAFFWTGWAGLVVFAAVGSFMLYNGMKEFFKFSNGISIKGFPVLTGIFALLLQLAALGYSICPYLKGKSPALETLLIAIFLVAGFILVFRSEDLKVGLHDLAMSIFGLFYIGWTLSFTVRIFTDCGANCQNGRMLLLFMLLVTKFSDIGAYFVGSACSKRPQGNHKIFPRLSPKKSWEGFFGGMAVSALVAVILVATFGDKMLFNGKEAIGLVSAILLAVVFTTLGFIGDIAESSFKRAGKLDDSGTILPGLGGAMDVLDSLIPVAPVFYAYLVLFG